MEKTAVFECDFAHSRDSDAANLICDNRELTGAEQVKILDPSASDSVLRLSSPSPHRGTWRKAQRDKTPELLARAAPARWGGLVHGDNGRTKR